ncbi:MAG: pyridoxamine 5'-phosphate oxidase family protein [Chitinophagaceae bacterium]
MFGKLNTSEIEDLLYRQFVGRIGCHADGLTYVVPVSYAYDGIYVYFHSVDGMKISMMRKNPRVCFEVDDTKNLSNWKSVISFGKFEELTKENERQEALKVLGRRTLPLLSSQTMHLTSQWPFPANEDERVAGIFFRIELMEKSGRFEHSEREFFYAT